MALLYAEKILEGQTGEVEKDVLEIEYSSPWKNGENKKFFWDEEFSKRKVSPQLKLIILNLWRKHGKSSKTRRKASADQEMGRTWA